MTMINTTDDFIRLLRENPEFHAAARRELLTEELLELPQRFSQYAQTTEKRLDSVDRGLGSLEQGQQTASKVMSKTCSRVSNASKAGSAVWRTV